MSGHQYVSNDIFESDVDDETFLANSRFNTSGGGLSTNPFENQRQIYEERRRNIEERTIASSERSLGLLYETEEVGAATANELAKQREQLERSNHQLDEISATLRFSQKHLNGLKSVFGGLKNYLYGKNEMHPGNKVVTSPTESKYSEQSNSNKLQQQKQQQSPTSSSDLYNNHPTTRLKSGSVENNIQSTKNAFQERYENNLDDMCNSISRLKGLATGMRGEIESQNEMLDSMTDKIEDIDVKLGKQNKQINSLLEKK